MMRLDYRTEKFQKVRVRGIPCDFSDMRIDRRTIPKGRYHYEVVNDDESRGNPVRVGYAIMMNFFGTLISDVPLPLGCAGVLWLQESYFACL